MVKYSIAIAEGSQQEGLGGYHVPLTPEPSIHKVPVNSGPGLSNPKLLDDLSNPKFLDD